MRLTLDVVRNRFTFAPEFIYLGHVGAPTIRVHPGDTIRIVLRNRLRATDYMPNDVNIHFHGMMVSPIAPADDAMRLAAPGQSLEYVVHIPRNHPPGLYWYHPHSHGEAYWQITSGLSGAIVVEGLQDRLPALKTMRERIIVLRNVQTNPDIWTLPIVSRTYGTVKFLRERHWPLSMMYPSSNGADPDGDASDGPCAADAGMRVTINGLPRATIDIAPGERQLFRVVNASAGRNFDLAVDGESLQVVALDGVPLADFPGASASESVEHLVLPPAGRAEFIVVGQSQPTIFRSRCYFAGSAGDPNPAVVLAELRSAGGASIQTPSQSPAPAQSVILNERRGAESSPMPSPAAYRRIVLTEDSRGFYIDGKAFDMSAPPLIIAHSGTVEEWTVVNRTDEVHDFHIHQVHFAVLTIDSQEAPRRWLDTVPVPPQYRTPGGSHPGTTVILVDFREPVTRGTFLFHCHILDHEDGGMMAFVRVI